MMQKLDFNNACTTDTSGKVQRRFTGRLKKKNENDVMCYGPLKLTNTNNVVCHVTYVVYSYRAEWGMGDEGHISLHVLCNC
jgi:hypothetical protein